MSSIKVPQIPPLQEYQQVAKEFIKNTPRCAIYLGMGTGKTLTTLTALYELRPPGNILVVAPLAIARSTWLDEIREREFPLRTVSLVVDDQDRRLSKAKRLELYAEIESSPPAMYFINESLLHDLVRFFNPNITPKWIHSDMAVKNPPRFPFDTLIIDEAQILGSPKSRLSAHVAYASFAVSRVIELTGTPVTEGYLKLWSQMFPIDHGARLGSRFTQFRDRFFVSTKKSPQGHPIGWELRPGADKQIESVIKDVTLSADVFNPLMPKTRVIDVPVVLSHKAAKAYTTLAKEQVVSFLHDEGIDIPDDQECQAGDVDISAANAAVLTSKLLQLASGTVYTSAEDRAADSSVPTSITVHEDKLDMLEYLIDSIDAPVLVAHMFVADRERIFERLKSKDCQIFDGSAEMTKRWNNREIPILLIHPQSAGHGINLQHGSSHLIWYTLPYSGQQYQQANARLARMGQSDDVVSIYRLITKNTIDEFQPRRLAGKYSQEQMFLDAVNKYRTVSS